MDRKSPEYREVLIGLKEKAEDQATKCGDDLLELLKDVALSLSVRLNSASMNYMDSIFWYSACARGQSTQKPEVGFTARGIAIESIDRERITLQNKLQLTLDLIRFIADQRIAEVVASDASCSKA